MELKDRFRGYLPVVVDLETGGFDATMHPLLEIACVFLRWSDRRLTPGDTYDWAVAPYPGATVDPASLKVTGIDLEDPARGALDEKVAMTDFFRTVRRAVKAAGCHRAILVAHNASFDQGFLKAAVTRQQIKRDPFHPFSTIDTAALSAVAHGHTVLKEACRRAGIGFDEARAHSAPYDADRAAELFCGIVNAWPLNSSGWNE